MFIELQVNGKNQVCSIEPDTVLLDVLRKMGFTSVKRGCGTSNCGLCTVLLEDEPVLSCSVLAIRVAGKQIRTLEGVHEEAKRFGTLLADQGGDQCGFCSPGFIMNVISLKKKFVNPTDDEIESYLLGNLCRCTGYQAQMRAIREYLEC